MLQKQRETLGKVLLWSFPSVSFVRTKGEHAGINYADTVVKTKVLMLSTTVSRTRCLEVPVCEIWWPLVGRTQIMCPQPSQILHSKKQDCSREE